MAQTVKSAKRDGKAPPDEKVLDSDKLAKLCTEVEDELYELRALYDQHFMGVERRPPTQKHSVLKRKASLVFDAPVRQGGLKFRIENLKARLISFERLWTRTLKEMEDGTSRRDRYRVRKFLKGKEQVAKTAATQAEARAELPPRTSAPTPPGVPAPALSAPRPPGLAPRPSVPAGWVPPTLSAPAAPRAAGAPPPPARAAPAAAASPLSDDTLRAVYNTYVKAREKCKEDTSKLSFESVAAALKKQVPEIMKQHNAKSVEFKVLIKDGKAILKATPR